MTVSGLIPTLFGVGGLVVAWYVFQKVKEYPAGEAKVAEIADAIHLGAMVFMRREYKFLTIFSAILLVFLLIVLGWQSALAFLVGALTSGIAGYIGMSTATQANVRTTTAAHTKGRGCADCCLLRWLHHGSCRCFDGAFGPRRALPHLRRRP